MKVKIHSDTKANIRRAAMACVLVAAGAARAPAEKTFKSEVFIDSVGINIHLDYADSGYATRFSDVEKALKDLRIRHFREGLVTNPIPGYFPHLNQLGSDGMKGIFITDPHNSVSTLQDFPQKVPHLVEGYEAPNEMDASKDPQWNQTLINFLPTLASAAASQRIPVIGPSLVKRESYALASGATPYITAANLHNYPGGRNPGTHGWGANGYGSLEYHKRNVREHLASLPIVTTETGYTNDLNAANSVPETVAAVYFPRLLLFQFMNGIARTYIYELLSTGHEDYGLMTNECERKPSFKAVEALMQMLDDHDARPLADDLDLKVDSDAAVQHLLLQRSDGRYFVPLWIEQPAYDVNAKRATAVQAGVASLQLPWNPRSVSVHQWTAEGTVETTSIASARMLKIPVKDCLTVLELVPPTGSH